MITLLKRSIHDVTRLLFPQVCINCGNDLTEEKQLLCLHCLADLPFTNFALHANNPVEKIFWGRLPLRAAMSLFYFNKNSSVQHLLQQLKYHGKKEVGVLMGKMIAGKLLNSNRFMNLDAVIPLPLSAKKEKQRGYNQSAMIADGIAEILMIPVLKDAITRTRATESQTHKNRIERWENMKDVFSLVDVRQITNKNILLVDDVITTGATSEACGANLLKAEGLTLNIASVAYTI
jgi:ComF family protein